MENNEIVLNITENDKIILSSDTPDMQKIIDCIIKNRNSLVPDNIYVEIPDNCKFDKDGFEEMMRGVIKEYLETLKLEDCDFNKHKNIMNEK